MGKIKALDIIFELIKMVISIRYIISASMYGEEHNIWVEKETLDFFSTFAFVFIIITIIGFLFSLFRDKKSEFSWLQKESRYGIIANIIAVLILLFITEEKVFSYFCNNGANLLEAAYGVEQFRIFKENFLVIFFVSLLKHLITYFVSTDYIALHSSTKEKNEYDNLQKPIESSLKRCEHCGYIITGDHTHCSMCGNIIEKRQ